MRGLPNAPSPSIGAPLIGDSFKETTAGPRILSGTGRTHLLSTHSRSPSTEWTVGQAVTALVPHSVSHRVPSDRRSGCNSAGALTWHLTVSGGVPVRMCAVPSTPSGALLAVAFEGSASCRDSATV